MKCSRVAQPESIALMVWFSRVWKNGRVQNGQSTCSSAIVPDGGKEVGVSQGHALVHANKSGLYSHCLWRRRWSSFQGKRTAVAVFYEGEG